MKWRLVMTTQSVKLTGLPYLDDELPYDAIRSLKKIKRGLEAIYNKNDRVNADMYIEVHETTISSIIADLHIAITDAEAVYAEHKDLSRLMQHLNKAIRHYEVED